ncbi:MAG: helix-turn-helix transcriptional regulator [Proteobacteria bacterium]|nr:helix-turn-helix transcriptional regulator [Pseudomonadota bacterium]
MICEQDINIAAFEYYGRLGKVKRFVDEHYADPVSLKKAAEIACLEEKYFSVFFHAKTGVRFVDWIAWVRVAHAKDLLRRENKPISIIGEESGFFDLRTFERSFKKCTGMTPTDFRKSVRPS